LKAGTGMRVIILGIGDAFTKRHFGASAVVQAASGNILIDCPDLIHRALHEMSSKSATLISAADIDDIILTHLHGDHCNGLESFGFYRRIMRLRGESAVIPRLHVIEEVAQRVWERLAPAMDAPMNASGEAALNHPSSLADYFDLRIMRPGSPSLIRGVSVHCRRTMHPIPTIGLKLVEGDAMLGWSGDTPFEAAHIQWLSEADVIVHESNLGTSHTPIEKLNDLSDSIKHKMRLIHLIDEFNPACTDIKQLREGEVIRFSASGQSKS
jgi:ribonuclease BN (tRNA processing enzyme)